jgi:hypothetical protein
MTSNAKKPAPVPLGLSPPEQGFRNRSPAHRDEAAIVEMATSPCAGNDKPDAHETGLRGRHLGGIA